MVRLPPKVMIEDSEALLNKPGSTYPLPPFYKRLFNGIDPVIPEEREVQVHAERIGDYTHQPLRLRICERLVTQDSWHNTVDRKPCATQAVAQGFPSRADTDRMSLQDPARHRLIGWGRLSNPERAHVRSRSAALPRAPSRGCPRWNSAAARHAGRIWIDALRPIVGFERARIVAAQEADDAVIAPFEI